MNFDLMKTLGIKKNVPKVDFTEYSGLIRGQSKIGKTKLASLLPNSVLVAFEQGYDAHVINYIDCFTNGWEAFVEFIDSLEDNREAVGEQLKLIIIDTAEEAYSSCESYMLRKESSRDGIKYSKIGDIPHGRGYSDKDEYFKKQIKRLYALGFKIIYLTHTEIKTVRPKDKRQEPYDIIKSTMPARQENIVMPEVSYIMNIERAVINGKATRVLKISGEDESSETGSRFYFSDDIPFESEEEAVSKFQEKFKEVIKNRLEKDGIKKSVEELSIEQNEEKMKEVLGNIETAKIENIKSEIEALKKELKGDDKIKVIAKLKENNCFVEKIDTETDVKKLTKMLEMMKSK